jgi:hypothetical protein
MGPAGRARLDGRADGQSDAVLAVAPCAHSVSEIVVVYASTQRIERTERIDLAPRFSQWRRLCLLREPLCMYAQSDYHDLESFSIFYHCHRITLLVFSCHSLFCF